MNTTEAIYTRRSVRSYKDTKVDRATVEKLIDAATRAPSAMNCQPWAFGVIQDTVLLRSISDRAKAYLQQLWGPDGYPPISDPDFNTFYNASTLLIIMAKPGDYRPEGDCNLAAENLMLMAHELGLATCWIGLSQMYLNTPEAKKEYGIPEDYTVVAPIILGYPDGEAPEKERDAPEIVFWKS